MTEVADFIYANEIYSTPSLDGWIVVILVWILRIYSIWFVHQTNQSMVGLLLAQSKIILITNIVFKASDDSNNNANKHLAYDKHTHEEL